MTPAEIADYIRRCPLREARKFESCVTERVLPAFENPAHDPDLDVMREVMLGLFAAGLFHLFEQEAGQLRRWAEGQGPDLWRQIRMQEVTNWLATFGAQVTDCPHWPKVNDELRHVANAMKHAEGDSVKKLRELRADLFMYPELREAFRDADVDSLYKSHAQAPVALPLAGYGVHITADDFNAYAAAVRDLWSWLADRLDAVEPKESRGPHQK